MDGTVRCHWCRNRTGLDVVRIRKDAWLCSRCDDKLIPKVVEQASE